MKVFWIDLFSGAGGTTTGIHLSKVGAKVVVCVNHDAEAIKCHKENHPECLHLTEDVRDLKVIIKIMEVVKKLREEFPDSFKLTGSKTNQLKFIGNSVVPLMAQRLIESNYKALYETKRT